MQDFHNLHVWTRANELAPTVRTLTDTFPIGYRSLKEQAIDAVESIPSNIAEGCGASTPKEFARYLDIAIKSACELEAQLELAKGYGIAAAQDLSASTDEVVQIRRMMVVLRKRVLGSPPPN